MANKIKETILKELRDQANRYEKGMTKRALLEGLYTKIKGYNNDEDIINTVWANRDLPLRMFTEPELKHMPGFNNLLIGDPSSEIDIDKAFGNDWEEGFENIPYNQIALVAEKHGEDPNKLLNRMANEATARRRKAIANEGALGAVMPFIAKRTQEAIERGETPSPTDVGLDIGQTVLEATPYGRAVKFVNNPVARTLIGGVVSNTAAPLLTEVADAALYDDDKRGEFNEWDVGTGALTNALGANFLRLAGAGLNKLGADKVSKVLMNLGNRESRGDAAKAVNDLHREVFNKGQMAKNFYDLESNTFKPGLEGRITDKVKAEVLDYVDNMDTYATREAILDKIRRANPSTKLSKLANDGYKLNLSDGEIRFMMKDPILSKYLSGDYNFYDLPSDLQLAGEEAVKNLLTNKLGSYQQEQGKAFTRIPFGLGRAIQNYIDEKDAEEAERKLIDDLYTKYKFDILGGNK